MDIHGWNERKSFMSQTGTNKEDRHENEACSPFCACACCGNVFVPYFPLNKITGIEQLVKPPQYYSCNNILLPSNFPGNIWQPPKFS